MLWVFVVFGNRDKLSFSNYFPPELALVNIFLPPCYSFEVKNKIIRYNLKLPRI